MIFQKSSKGVVGGIFFNPKVYVADFILQHDFPKKGGLMAVLVRSPGLIEVCVDFDQMDNNDFYSSTS